jgi:hypothetical protein
MGPNICSSFGTSNRLLWGGPNSWLVELTTHNEWVFEPSQGLRPNNEVSERNLYFFETILFGLWSQRNQSFFATINLIMIWSQRISQIRDAQALRPSIANMVWEQESLVWAQIMVGSLSSLTQKGPKIDLENSGVLPLRMQGIRLKQLVVSKLDKVDA